MKKENENHVNIQTQEPQKGYYIDDSTKNVSPEPVMESPEYKGSGKLKNKVAVITGGDSGIGGAVAIAFAKEGGDNIYDAAHLPLIIGIIVASLVGLFCGRTFPNNAK